MRTRPAEADPLPLTRRSPMVGVPDHLGESEKLDHSRGKCNDRTVYEGAAVYIDSAKAYFGVWAPRDCPSPQPLVQGGTGWRVLLLRRIRLRGEHLASVPEAPASVSRARTS